MKFSDRIGHTTPVTLLQLEGMSDSLRTRLWSVLYQNLWNLFVGGAPLFGDGDEGYVHRKWIIEQYWIHHLKIPIDALRFHPERTGEYRALQRIRSQHFDTEWYEVYNTIEYIIERMDTKRSAILSREINLTLEGEVAGYRIIDRHVVPIANEAEVESVASVVAIPDGDVRRHFQRAIELLSVKPEPQFGNVIKESVSALEALAKRITQDPNATLSSAVKKIRDDEFIHPALVEVMNKIYGFAGDASGARHSLKAGQPEPGFDEAKLILVTCASIAHYIIAKSDQPRLK